MRTTLLASGFSACTLWLTGCAGDTAVQPTVTLLAAPFATEDVRLLEAPWPSINPFKAARDSHGSYLLELNADRLLARYRSEAGLSPKAEGYGGWEKDTIGGHTLGHYLSACAKMYAGTGDPRFKARVDYIVSELRACQNANTARGLTGYVAAIPGGAKALAEVRAGDIRSKGFDLNGIWVPWYTIHKEMAGLRDAYIHCDNRQALAVWRGLADYSLSIVGGLSPEQLSRMLRCEHGGMNEVAADLYAITGDARYLDLARRFNDHQILDPLVEKKDILPGLHSNTQIPKLIGAARQYELTGDRRWRDAARFFWSTMTAHHSYATGGNSMNEYLGPPDTIAARLEGNTTETCNTYNMLKLSTHLHAWSADPAIMDYYEKALYNHILASKDPHGHGVCYFLPLRPGAAKEFQRPFEDFTCCVGSGMENHASYGDAIYSHRDQADGDGPALFVNLYIASEVRWNALGVRVRQETAFPASSMSMLHITCDKPTSFYINIRIPPWLDAAASVEVDGRTQTVHPGSKAHYFTIFREWKPGDTVRIVLPMGLRTEAAPDDSDRVVLRYGPLVLAGVMGDHEAELSTTPHFVMGASENPGDFAAYVDPRALRFRTRNVKPANLDLIPLYQIADQHYTVYWKRLSPDQWTARASDIAKAEAAERAMAARSVDFFQPGEMQPERDHRFDGVFTNAGEHMGRRWRDAGPRGHLAFTMKLPASGPATLVCTYWGSDTGREFDVLIDDTVIATQVLSRNKPGQFFDVEYAIPARLLAGKREVRVKLVGKPGKMTGGLFAARILQPPP